MNIRYPVTLSDEERTQLQALLKGCHFSAHRSQLQALKLTSFGFGFCLYLASFGGVEFFVFTDAVPIAVAGIWRGVRYDCPSSVKQ